MVLTDEMRFTIKSCFEQKGWRGARLVAEFPSFNWTKESINRMIKKLEETGSCARRPGSGRPRTALSENDKKLVEELACSQDEPGTHLSQRKMARRLGVSRLSIQRHLKCKNMKAFKRLIVPPMPAAVRQKRKSRARNLYQKISSAEVQQVVFTDEKDFTLEVPVNPQNNRVYWSGRKSEVPPQRLYHEKSRFSKKVMVSAGVSCSSKTDIFFLETDGSAKVNLAVYIRHLEEKLLPACEELHPSGFIFQQDGAPSHTSRATQECLARRCRFISKSEWPPNSPDLNPLDYHVWDALSEAVYRERREKFATIAELKAAIAAAWEEVSLSTIKRSIDQWKPRLRAVVQADGGPIAHVFK